MHSHLQLHPEDGGITLLRNVGNNVPVDMGQYPEVLKLHKISAFANRCVSTYTPNSMHSFSSCSVIRKTRILLTDLCSLENIVPTTPIAEIDNTYL